MKSVISRIEKLEQAATQHNFLSQVSHRIIQRGVRDSLRKVAGLLRQLDERNQSVD